MGGEGKERGEEGRGGEGEGRGGEGRGGDEPHTNAGTWAPSYVATLLSTSFLHCLLFMLFAFTHLHSHVSNCDCVLG